MSGSQSEKIEIRGVQKTNVGPVGEGDDINIFEYGVIGGPVSDEFEDALRFSRLLSEEKEDG